MSRSRLLSGLLLLALAPAAARGQDATQLTLDAAIGEIDATLQVENAERRIEQADDVRRQALAALRPTVALSATYTLRDEEIELDFGNPYLPLAPYLEAIHTVAPELPDPSPLLAPSEPQVVQYRHDIGASLAVDQSLYNARALPYIRQSQVAIRQAENSLEVLRFQLRGAVTQAYFAAVLQRRLIDVSERNVELARLALQRAQIAFEEDVGNRFEMNRARVELSSAERDLQNAQTGYDIARRNLAGLIGRTDIDFEVLPPPTLSTDLPTTDVEGRPDIEAYALQTELQEHRVAEARGQWFPTLFAHLQGNVQRATAFGGDNFSWFLQIGANWTVYDGGTRSALGHQRERDLVTTETQRADALATVETAIDAGVLEALTLQRQIESAHADVALARENVELTEAAVELGVATSLDTQLAREQLYLSELALATLDVNLQARLYELRRISGSDVGP
ncbi:MAG: TolC family protein [Myxococcales bacterium]|nr:TolC family protein [Myxococcales bacterium]